MNARSVPFYKPEFLPEHRRATGEAIEQILASGQLMMGPYKDKFEAQFRTLTGCPHAISLNSATTGLQIALQYYGVQQREVLVPAAAFLTDASAVKFAGGEPVLVDVNEQTLALDLEDLERKRTARTKGIIWVHLTGYISPDYNAIRTFAKEHNLFLIEDASHAHGAEIDGHNAGSLGDVGVFSFYPTKVVTAGTGGMLTTADAKLASYAEEMRMFGKDAKGTIVHLGNDWFLDEIRACVGYHHALDLPRQLSRRREIAARYTAHLRSRDGFRCLDISGTHRPSWYHFCVVLDGGLPRHEICKALSEADGIATKQIYRPLHHEQVFRHLDDGTLKSTERILDRAIAFPLYVGMSDEDVDYVAERVLARVNERV